ncbi:MAG: hypothetical protein ACYC96_15100 [Fimbriimonadaceae bacterium]
MDPAVRCPQCHCVVTPGAPSCEFCGFSMQDLVVRVDEPRTWQETAYLVSSAVMVLQGGMFVAAGLGFGVPEFAYPPASYIGIGVIVVGIGLLRDQVWAQWVARVAGIIALVDYGSMALRYGLSVGTVPHALGFCFIGIGWFLYWVFLEYLIWEVAD